MVPVRVETFVPRCRISSVTRRERERERERELSLAPASDPRHLSFQQLASSDAAADLYRAR